MAIPLLYSFFWQSLLLFINYSSDPELGAASGFFSDARDVFPQYIKNCIPTGARGLMIIGLIAAALSSFNSAINAMASSFVTDSVSSDTKAERKRDKGECRADFIV